MRVLILHAGALGDFVITLHWVAALRAANPDAVCHAVARSSLLPWSLKHGLLEGGLSWEQSELHRLFGKGVNDAEPQWRLWRNYDAIISFVGRADDRFHGHLRRINRARIIIIDPRAPDPPLGLHITEAWSLACRRQGLKVGEITAATVNVASEVRASVRAKFDSLTGQDRSRKYAIFHPGSGGLKKCRSIGEWESAAHVWKSAGIRVIWMLGPDELEREGPMMKRRLEQSGPVLYEESLDQAADVLASADAFVGHDAGMTHVAALCGVPTVAVFHATDPQVWRPLGRRVRVHQDPLELLTPNGVFQDSGPGPEYSPAKR